MDLNPENVMKFPFERISEHRVYPRTFLHNVEARFHYKSDDQEFTVKFIDFMQNTFGITIEKQWVDALGMIPLRIHTENSKQKCKITDDFVEISLSGSGYTSFMMSLYPMLTAFDNFFNSVGANLSKVSLKKINTLPIPGTMSYQEAFSLMFSQEFLIIERGEPIKADSDDLRWLVSLEETERYLGLKMLVEFHKVKEKDLNYISLQSQASYAVEVKGAELSGAMLQLNSVLYDAFHWAINKNLIEEMRKEDVE